MATIRFQLAALFLLQATWRVTAQQVGTLSEEEGPSVTIKHCTKAGGCKEEETTLTMDANWRWTHSTKGSDNCYTDGEWDAKLCPDPESCSKNCALDGVTSDSYEGTYGVTEVPGGVKLKFVTEGPYGTNVGSRMYMLEGEDTYKMFKLKNREFTFDVAGATLTCGLNGALYMVEMKKDGGISTHNKAGAKYGTGYCDAQCPHDVKFMGGKANVDEWDSETALGKLGHCCTELDLWEANTADTAFTPHPCDTTGPLICHGTKCGDLKTNERYKGVCDKDGCDFNTFRMGNETFFGPGSKFNVDSTKPVTVVTRFLTDDGTDEGDLVEMRRFYVQDGNVISNAFSSIDGVEGDAVNDKFCAAQKKVFQDPDDFSKKGGMAEMGKAMDRGMVLVLSLWDDEATDMLWLDATAPANSHRPGARRGPCAESSGKPKDLRSKHADASVSYYNFKYGEIGSTVKGISETKPSAPSSSASSGPAPAPPSLGGFTSASSSSSSSDSEDEDGYCCLAGHGTANRCATCHPHGRVHGESWCGRSKSNCEQCTKLAIWCSGSDDEGDESSSGSFDSDDDPLFARKSAVTSPFVALKAHLPAALVALLAVGFVGTVAATAASSRARAASRRTVVGKLYAQLSVQAAPGRAEAEPKSTEVTAAFL